MPNCQNMWKTPVIDSRMDIVESTELTQIDPLPCSLLEFFRKMEKWAAMTKLDMGRRLTALKDSFNVTTIMFSKFHQVFVELFTGFEQDQSNMNRARRYRRGPTSVSDIYKLCWLLYISLKNRINTETVSCFHLLLCCLDFVYVSCVIAGRTDLFNQDFYQGERRSLFLEPRSDKIFVISDEFNGSPQRDFRWSLVNLCLKYYLLFQSNSASAKLPESS